MMKKGVNELPNIDEEEECKIKEKTLFQKAGMYCFWTGTWYWYWFVSIWISSQNRKQNANTNMNTNIKYIKHEYPYIYIKHIS